MRPDSRRQGHSAPETEDDFLEPPSKSSRKREMQALQDLGKLMRKIDPEPIQTQLEIFAGNSAAEVAKMHRLERLREQLLEDEQTIGTIAETWPDADLQYLRTLRRNALKEREAGKPPKSFREIFRVLRELQAAQETEAEEAAALGQVADDDGDEDASPRP